MHSPRKLVCSNGSGLSVLCPTAAPTGVGACEQHRHEEPRSSLSSPDCPHTAQRTRSADYLLRP
eukprot:scaffold56772_cov35-Tisochrysis_lutea.AAC.2